MPHNLAPKSRCTRQEVRRLPNRAGTRILAVVALGRRLYIHILWRKLVFPNLYLMLVAVSTYYRKSAILPPFLAQIDSFSEGFPLS